MEHYVKKVLVVEDDLALRPLWENFFKYRFEAVFLEWAVSGEEAIKMINQNNENKTPYFLIITDIFLAGSKTGMELIKSSEVIASEARTILVSAVDRNEIIEKLGHLIPGTLVISKPLDFHKYESVFRDILKDNESRRSRVA